MIGRIYLSLLLAAVSLGAACGGTENANNTAANGNANANSSSHPPMNTVRNDGPTENNAPTLGPVVQQYNEALKTKNDQMLRDTLSASLTKSLEDDMKAAKRKDFAAYVAETDYQPGQVIEVRNEKINGNKGVAQLKGGQYKVWTAFSFTLENGKWRLDNGSPELDNMPPTNSNTAR